MCNNKDDSATIIIKGLEAHGVVLGKAIEDTGEKLLSGIMSLHDVISGVADGVESRPELIEFRLQLEKLALAFRPIIEIYTQIVSTSRGVKDKDFKSIVSEWQICKRDAYFNICSVSTKISTKYPWCATMLQNLDEDGKAIEEKILKPDRNGLLEVINRFDGNLHALLSLVKSREPSVGFQS